MGLKTSIRSGEDMKIVMELRGKKRNTIINRGDIYCIDFGMNYGAEKGGIRPAVVISNNGINATSSNIIVVPMTSIQNKINDGNVAKLTPSQVILSRKFYTNLSHTSIIQTEDVRSVSKGRVGKRIGNLSPRSLEDVEIALQHTVGVS